MLLDQKRNIYFINICGLSMRALADMLHQQGHHISGSDTQIVKLDNMQCFLQGERPTIPIDTDLVVYNNIKNFADFIEAKRIGLPLIHRAELFNQITSSRPKKVLVSGTAGKSSTTYFIGCLLKALDIPHCNLAAIHFDHGKTYEDYGGPYICEHNEQDLLVCVDDTECVVLTNMHFEHIWDFNNEPERLKSLYLELLNKTKVIIYNYDDLVFREWVNAIDDSKMKIPVGTIPNDSQSYFQILNIIDNIDGINWDIKYQNHIYHVKSKLNGVFTPSNVTEAIAVLHKFFNIDLNIIIEHIINLSLPRDRGNIIYSDEKLKVFSFRAPALLSVEQNIESLLKYNVPINISYSVVTPARITAYKESIVNILKTYRSNTLIEEYAQDGIPLIKSQEDFDQFINNSLGILLIIHSRFCFKKYLRNWAKKYNKKIDILEEC